jgi:hypothetical protein
MPNSSEIPENVMFLNDDPENAKPEIKQSPLGRLICVNAVESNANLPISRRRAPGSNVTDVSDLQEPKESSQSTSTDEGR